MLLDLIAKHAAKDTCKGIFYRYTENNYTTAQGRVVLNKELCPLKKISCPGCEQCGGQTSALQDVFSIDPNCAIEFSSKLQHKDIARLVFVARSRHPETSQVEDYYYEAVKVPQETNADN